MLANTEAVVLDIIMNDDRTQLDDISQRCSDWSTNVALLTAINDYFESYGGDEETVQLFFPSVSHQFKLIKFCSNWFKLVQTV